MFYITFSKDEKMAHDPLKKSQHGKSFLPKKTHTQNLLSEGALDQVAFLRERRAGVCPSPEHTAVCCQCLN